jgi:hypothetical protein
VRDTLTHIEGGLNHDQHAEREPIRQRVTGQ